jgi:hypothetical protein
MASSLLSTHHPLRIFFVSSLITIASLAFIGVEFGLTALFVALVLVIIEVTFSFDNAIINAKVLAGMSRFWQTLFMTVGIFIAVFGMRFVFPIAIVMITSGLGAGQVIDLALNNPEKYSQELHDSHVSIAAFGGMFLLMLCFHFFFDSSRKIQWIDIIEKPLQQLGQWWTYALASFVVLVTLTLLPFNTHPGDTFTAGLVGILTYLIVHGLAELFTKGRKASIKGPKSRVVARTGMAGFTSFLYLEVLDASFSLDGVIGAFAITQDVVLIAIGLGVGALWVRSLTLFMVRHRVLNAYRYLEHGAHYTIGILASVMLLSLFVDIPEAIAGVAGLIVVGLSIISSIAATRRESAIQ